MNQRLREMDAQKDELLSQISHEVRTPMTSIRSFSDILLNDRELDESRRRRFLAIIQKESSRLLDDILDLSLLERGAQSWQLAVFDAEAVLGEALESCEALAHSAGVELVRSGSVESGLVERSPSGAVRGQRFRQRARHPVKGSRTHLREIRAPAPGSASPSAAKSSNSSAAVSSSARAGSAAPNSRSG
jgi:signal transduction histidine kinase